MKKKALSAMTKKKTGFIKPVLKLAINNTQLFKITYQQ